MSRTTAIPARTPAFAPDDSRTAVADSAQRGCDASSPFVGDSASEAKRAALIGLDWGTTSLRAYLFDSTGNVIARRASAAGIMNLPYPADRGGFDAAFEAVCGAWLSHRPELPVIAAGMVGSAQGWTQAPYAGVPANADSLVERMVQVRAVCGAMVSIVPGVMSQGDLPNVMRGEETQIVGASSAGVSSASDSAPALIGLPGTHAKWAIVMGGSIQHFHTFMTGEVFAALSVHTILGRTMISPECVQTDAFLRGVNVARRWNVAGVLSTIFSTRTLGLTAQLSAQQQPDYLSGLLIGHELAGLEGILAQQNIALCDQVPTLIGDEALCERYRLALPVFGCERVQIVQHATDRGLWSIASKAGLVAPAAPSTLADAAPLPPGDGADAGI
jgi:2-dehydro-3-deoxygalactonokinase